MIQSKKFLFLLAALTLPQFVIADSGESRSFIFQGQSSESLSLRGEISHTEYRYENVPSTCYRQVFSHYDQICHLESYPVCRSPLAFAVDGILGLFVNQAQAQRRPGGGGGGGGDYDPRRPEPDTDRPDRGGGGGHRPDPDRGGGGGHRPDPDRGGGGGGHRPDPDRGGGGGHRPDPDRGGGGGHRPDPDRGGGGGRRPDPDRGGGGGHRPDPDRGGGGSHRPDPRDPRRPDPDHGRPRCRTEYRRVCHQEPRYITEPYTCYQSVRIPYTVKDADVVANVKLDFDEVPAGIQINDEFTVNLNGRQVSMSVKSNNQVIYASEKSQSETSSGQLIQTDVHFGVTMVSAAELNNAVQNGIADLKVENGVLSFTIGKVTYLETIAPKVLIKKKKFLADKTLIHQVLQPHEFSATTIGNRTRLDIQLSALALAEPLQDGKFDITASVALKLPTNIVNPQAVSNAEPKIKAEFKFQ